MKALLLIILIYVSSHSIVRAQYCGSNGIPLTSQANIDNFAANYPGCIVVQGYVFIAGNDITNLNGLSQVTEHYGRPSDLTEPQSDQSDRPELVEIR